MDRTDLTWQETIESTKMEFGSNLNDARQHIHGTFGGSGDSVLNSKTQLGYVEIRKNEL